MFFFQVFQDLYWAIYLSLLGPCSLPRAMLVRLVNLGLQKPYSMLSFSLQNLVLAYFEFPYSHSCPMPQMQEYFVKKNDRVEVVCMIGVYGLLVSSIQLYPFLFGHMLTHTNMYIRLCMELKFQLLVNVFQFSFGDNFMEYHTGESQCNLTKNAAFILNTLLDRCWSLRVWN